MIYFIESGPGGPIKIGFTKTRDISYRVKDLQCGNPEELHVLALFDGEREDETRLHHIFDKYWIRGEWYRPGEDLLAFLEENKHENYYGRRVSIRVTETWSEPAVG
jgi:hypothetical protein